METAQKKPPATIPYDSKAPDKQWQDYYNLLRTQITQSHELVNQRSIWMAISQSFFYGAYVGIANAPKEAKNALYGRQQDLLLWLLPVAALMACTFVYMGIIARVYYLGRLRREFKKTGIEDDNFEQYPPIDAVQLVRTLENAGSLVLPVIFIMSWIVVLIRQVN